MKPPKLERKPAHALRPSTDNRRSRRKHAPVEETRADLTRPDGWYMQPVRRASAMHPDGWPPGGAAGVIRSAVRADGLTPSESATKSVEDGRKAGKSYAFGTVPMRGTPKLSKVPGAVR